MLSERFADGQFKTQPIKAQPGPGRRYGTLEWRPPPGTPPDRSRGRTSRPPKYTYSRSSDVSGRSLLLIPTPRGRATNTVWSPATTLFTTRASIETIASLSHGTRRRGDSSYSISVKLSGVRARAE